MIDKAEYRRFEKNPSIGYNLKALLIELTGKPIATVIALAMICGLTVWWFLSSTSGDMVSAVMGFICAIMLFAAVKTYLMFSAYADRHGQDYDGSFFVISILISLIAVLAFVIPVLIAGFWGHGGSLSFFEWITLVVFCLAVLVGLSHRIHRVLVRRNR